MPWLETNVRDQRLQFVLAVRQRRGTVTTLCQAFGISRQTGYKWLRREATAGSVAVLADQSRRPHHSPTRTDTEKTARILALRDEFGWGGAKLACLLGAEGRPVSRRTIDRIIQREGRTRHDTAPRPALHRFEHGAPNDLWQMDAKGAYPLAAGGRCHPLSILDDHSRFAVGLSALPGLTTDLVRPALVECFQCYGVPRAMLMDHGTPWWASASRDGLTTLSVFLLKQGIQLLYGAVRHPQTQGKVERFHRTLGERLRWRGVPTTLGQFVYALRWFREEYNEVRPHAALAMQPPAGRFTPSRRAYQATPPPWQYPSHLETRPVHRNGRIGFGGVHHFVSEALRGEEVACVPLDDRVLVMYRHMFVRELHLRSRRSIPLLEPVVEPWPADATASTGYDLSAMS
jgi:transposase InsO family protein